MIETYDKTTPILLSKALASKIRNVSLRGKTKIGVKKSILDVKKTFYHH